MNRRNGVIGYLVNFHSTSPYTAAVISLNAMRQMIVVEPIPQPEQKKMTVPPTMEVVPSQSIASKPCTMDARVFRFGERRARRPLLGLQPALRVPGLVNLEHEKAEHSKTYK